MFSKNTGVCILLSAIISLLLMNVSAAYAYETGVIAGFVTDSATGKPIYGASAILVGKAVGAKTDVTGAFSIQRVSPGTYILKIAYIGYVPVIIDSITVVSDMTVTINRALHKSQIDTGVILREVNTKDKFRSVTYNESLAGPIMPKKVTTIDELLTQVTGVVPNSDGQVLICGGKADEVAYIFTSDSGHIHYPLSAFGEQVDAGKALAATPANLGPTGTITGFVTDSATGGPIFGASVIVVGKAIGDKADSTGTFFIRDIPPGIYSLRISCIDYLSTDVTSIAVKADSTITIGTKLQKGITDYSGIRKHPGVQDIIDRFGQEAPASKSLEASQIKGPTGTITGIITDSADGTPIVGAHVCVLEAALGGKTDSSGLYVISNVPIGTYCLIVGTPDYLVFDMPAVTVVADSTITVSQKLPKRVTDTNSRSKIKTPPDSAK